MSEELKEKLDSFVKYIIVKINKDDQEALSETQKRYNELIDIISNSIFITKEDWESFEKIASDCDELQKEVKSYKAQQVIDADKIKSMKAELANNMELNEKYKKLNEEYNVLKQKYNVCYNDNTEFQMKIKNNDKVINDLQEEISKCKKENFEKFEKITEIEKDLKLNEIKLNQNNEKLNKLTIDNSELVKTNNELRNKYLDQQKNYQNKLILLEKQIENLTESNNNFVKENNAIQAELRNFQIWTNKVRATKDILEKDDFSILEKLSQRAEIAELEVQKLLQYIEDLKALNEKLRKKMKPLEDYALLQIKHDHEINTGIDTINDLKNKLFTDEEKEEIEKLKNEPNELLQSLIKLKAENLELHNQLKDITIECNQQLRDAKKK